MTIDAALSSLYEERDRLRATLVETESGIAALEAVIAARGGTPVPTAQLPAQPEAPVRRRVSSGGNREAILDVFRDQEDALDADGVYAALLERGWQSSSHRPRHVVVSTLWKLLQAGDIVKVTEGTYRLASQEAASDGERDVA